MNSSQDAASPRVPTQILNQWDALCDEFEQAWRSGSHPRIELFLERVPGEQRMGLLSELLLVEFAYVERSGAAVAPAEYAARFPHDKEVVAAAWQRHASQRDAGRPTADPSPVDAGLAETHGLRLDESVTPRRATSVSPEPARGPKEFAGFRLKGVLGEGGFGTVFRAEDPQLQRTVALKVLHAKALAYEGSRELFLSEARALAAVHNDHVVPIYQVGEAEGQPYLVMPLLAGESLAARLERVGALPIAEVRRIGCEIAVGLAAIHAKGLIHRDLKPANIWLEADTQRVKVLDLGLAHDPQAAVEGLAGTPAYMSPEQAQGRELDCRSDLFSLGTILYECATGRRPFFKSTLADTLRAVREESLPPPAKINPAVPDALGRVIEQLQRKQPAERPTSAQDVRSLLQNESPQPSGMPVADASGARWPIMVAGAAAAILVVTAILWRTVFTGSPPHPAGPVAASSAASSPEAHRHPPKITAFDITHFARVADGSQVENRGVFGQSTWSAKQRDLVTLEVKLDRPAYAYLLAFRPDGVLELCYPEEEHVVPPLAATASYPSEAASRSKGYGLSESPGLWIFTAIVSETPLPPFQEWKQRHSLPTPRNMQGPRGVVLVDDGQSIDHWSAAGARRSTRGKGEAIPGQQVLETIDNAVKQALPHASLRSLGIVAEPVP